MAHRIAFFAPAQADRVDLMVEIARSHPDLELDVISPDLSPPEELALLAAHDVVIMGTRVTMKTLRGCPRLKFIQLMSAGYDTFDVPALGARGVLFANSSASVAPSVAEHAITLMLAVKRRLREGWQSVTARRWSDDVEMELYSELSGATVGIIGLGHIGREVAKRLVGWDVHLVYHDAASIPADVEKALGARKLDLDELLRVADVVSLHVSLSSATRHLVGARELGLMQRSAILINTCRGPAVDEAALVQALVSGQIAGAGLDVLEMEPPSSDNPLLDLPNVLVTPHVGGASIQRVRRATEFALENVGRFLKGETPLSLIKG